MSTFQSELGCIFELQLEANHVILDKQVWVSSIGNGPNGQELTATYEKREKVEYQDELGNLVVEICKVVSNFFFLKLVS
jgi:Fanconi anemia group J protein